MMNIQDTLIQFRDDIITWVTNNLAVRVPVTRKINGKTLENDITITAEDIGAASPDFVADIKSDAVATSKAYTDGKVSTTLNEAKSYTNTQIKNHSHKISDVSQLQEQLDSKTSLATQDTEPTDGSDLWLDTSSEETFNLPEINDKTTNTYDTWSSKKINDSINDAKSVLSQANTEISGVKTEVSNLKSTKFDKANFVYENGTLTIIL